jgi:MYXO-CTERM domain-containing protein
VALGEAKGVVRRLYLLAAMVGLFLVGAGVPAQACKCLPRTPTEMLASAEAAFVGTSGASLGVDPNGNEVWAFEVEAWFTQAGGPSTDVTMWGEGTDCELILDAPQRMAVFVEGGVSGMCSVHDADLALAELGGGTASSGASEVTTPEEPSPDWGAIGLGIGGLAAIGIAGLLVRRRRA